MKFFDIEGTNKETFSIGLGSNKIELRAIEGRLFFRNRGEGFAPVGSAIENTLVSPRFWSTNSGFFQGEFIIHNGSLWRITSAHTSTTNFSDNYDKVIKVGDIDNFTRISMSGGITQLNEESSKFIYVDGAGGQTLRLPNALTLANGYQLFIQNNSLTDVIEIRTNSTDLLVYELQPETGVIVTLLNNASFAGSWTILPVGAGSSNSVIFKIQSAPGLLTQGTIVELNSSGNWVAANLSTASYSVRDFGVVTKIGATSFEVTTFGEFEIPDSLIGMVTGTEYYLGTTTGEYSSTPSSVFLFRCIDDTLFKGFINPKVLKSDIAPVLCENPNKPNEFNTLSGAIAYITRNGLSNNIGVYCDIGEEVEIDISANVGLDLTGYRFFGLYSYNRSENWSFPFSLRLFGDMIGKNPFPTFLQDLKFIIDPSSPVTINTTGFNMVLANSYLQVSSGVNGVTMNVSSAPASFLLSNSYISKESQFTTPVNLTPVIIGTGNTAIVSVSDGYCGICDNFFSGFNSLQVRKIGSAVSAITPKATDVLPFVGNNSGVSNSYNLAGIDLGWANYNELAAKRISIDGAQTITSPGDLSNISVQSSQIRLTNATEVRSISSTFLSNILTITNASAADIIIKNELLSETTENRILTGTGSDITLRVNASLFFIYDKVSQRWRVIGGSGGEGLGSDGLIYSPSVPTINLKAGQYNNWSLLLTDLPSLPIPKVYFTENSTIPRGDYYECEFIGYRVEDLRSRVTIQFSGALVNNIIPKKITNISLLTGVSVGTQTVTNRRFFLENSSLSLEDVFNFPDNSIQITLRNGSQITGTTFTPRFVSTSSDPLRSVFIDVFDGAFLQDNLFSNYAIITLNFRNEAFDTSRSDEPLFPVIGPVTKAIGGLDPTIVRHGSYQRIRKFSEVVVGSPKSTFTLPIKGTEESVIVFIDGSPQFENFTVLNTTLTFSFNVEVGQVVNGWVISL